MTMNEANKCIPTFKAHNQLPVERNYEINSLEIGAQIL